MASKKRKLKKKKHNQSIKFYTLIGFFLVIIVVAIIAVMLVINFEKQHDVSKQVSQNEKSGLKFPYELDNGNLILSSVFSYSGMNPDCNDENGENIGAIQLINNTDDYLESADITVITSEDKKLVFRVEDIPAKQTVMAFETNNAVYADTAIKMIKAEPHYTKDVTLQEDKLSTVTDENGITVGNLTEEEITGISIRYHCILDDLYWGGCCYQSTIDGLAQGESTLLDAEECYVGEAAVVNISIN